MNVRGPAIARLGRAAGDKDADRVDARAHKHIEYRPPDPGEIDDELRTTWPLCQEPADTGDGGGVGRTKRQALKIPDLINRRR